MILSFSHALKTVRTAQDVWPRKRETGDGQDVELKRLDRSTDGLI